MKPKDAFWLKSTGSAANPGVPHLFCVLTPPCPKGEQLIVNLTSRRPAVPFDPACTAGFGDHPDITGPSYFIYEEARTIYPKLIPVWQADHMITMTTPFSDQLYQRVCVGFLQSAFATPKLQTYLRVNAAGLFTPPKGNKG